MKLSRRPRHRVTRACDQCTRKKVRCDGSDPCSQCLKVGERCQYAKLVQKRGPAGQRISEKHPTQITEMPAPVRIHNSFSPPYASLDALGPARNGDANRPLSPRQRHHSAVEFATSDVPMSHESEAGGEPPHAIHDHPAIDKLSPKEQQQEYSYAGAIAERRCTPSSNPVSISSILSPVQSVQEARRLSTSSLNAASTDSFLTSQISAEHTGQSNSLPRISQSPHHSRQGPQMYSYSSASVTSHLSTAPKSRFPCLEPLLPALNGIISINEACDLLSSFFNGTKSLFFPCGSPYMTIEILRAESVLHPIHPRPLAPALISTMLWCAAQTADMRVFDLPGARSRIIQSLYCLSLSLVKVEDPDNYYRSCGKWQFDNTCLAESDIASVLKLCDRPVDQAPGSVDGVLAMLILTLVISGGDYKADSFKWWTKTLRLTRLLGIDMVDADDRLSTRDGYQVGVETKATSFREEEAKEERRRLFWLLYCLDRHLALSFNRALCIVDGTFCVLAPLSEGAWRNLESTYQNAGPRSFEPPNRITGPHFFDYFLPLMRTLGYIIDLHRQSFHPLRNMYGLEQTKALIEGILFQHQEQLRNLQSTAARSTHLHRYIDSNGRFPHSVSYETESERQSALMIAYCTHILHVLFILLYGKWDAISMIENDDDWITSPNFVRCSNHAIEACQAISKILSLDPELTFMPYLFGIYLLHGSFIVLLFADRMPQLGPNESVAEICEIVIRAHEASIVTLDTIFQKNFRRVLRSMLYEVRGDEYTGHGEGARRRELLSLYRWTPEGKGLAY